MGLYPEIEPYERGMLRAGDDDLLYWETCGNPGGRPVVVLHGGPGSGCSPWHRRFFDPAAYRIVLWDQRGCGRSMPHASEPQADLSGNNTANLVSDLEALRRHLAIDRWMVWGGSWGSTLALVYAQTHPDAVSEIVLWGVTTGRRAEFDRVFRGGLAPLFPAEWRRLSAHVSAGMQGLDVVEAYNRLLVNPDPRVHQPAAEAWCRWESAISGWPPQDGLAPRFRDAAYALAFARIVTHYVHHDAWLEEGALLEGAAALAGIPGVMVCAESDVQAPLENARALLGAWPGADLVVVEGAEHSPAAGRVATALVAATDRFAAAR